MERKIITNRFDTVINIKLIENELPGGTNWYSLQLNFCERTDTKTQTIVILNTITKNDLTNLSKIFTELAESIEN